MFLKRIDLVGFKSFADKTAFEMSPGLTAVVGPNGSGKSNVADAIRWVLGEQSARNLRGTKMEDVIFAGSETRRAVNFCEVTLTLDNEDRHLPVVFDEVTITRRVYRSGDSEYLMNKQQCRLKDITELFMDSGLGRESYSIIGQGRIEEMLSTKPEDRRGPFEDAAGIVKFKHQRRESERKLEETAVNVTRVEDILAELERQAGPLEEDAKRTRIYQTVRSELTELDISLLVHQIERLKVSWEQAEKDVKDVVSQRLVITESMHASENILQSKRQLLNDAIAQIEAIQQQVTQRVEERERIDGHLKLLKERQSNADMTLDDRDGQKKILSVEEEEVTEQLTSVNARLQTVNGKLEFLVGDLEVATAAIDPLVQQKLEMKIRELNAALFDFHQQTAAARNQLSTATETLESDERKADRLNQEQSRWEDEKTKLLRDLGESESVRADMRDQLEGARKAVELLTNQMQDEVTLESKMVSELHGVQQGMAALQSRVELLRDLEEGYDGYAIGVKTILHSGDKGKLTGIHGALASLIQVNQAVDIAMETALGSTLQNIVVSTEADARAAINLLKQRQAGRATFMPLTTIKGRLLSPYEHQKLNSLDGVVGIGSQLVGFEPQYQSIVEHLLGNVIIAKTLVDANTIAKRLDYRYRIVTLDGDVVSPGGSMSGGSHSRGGPGLLGRSREKSNLEEKFTLAQALEQDLKMEQSRLRERQSQLRTEQQALMYETNQLQAHANGLDNTFNEQSARLQNVQERVSAYEWEQAQALQGKQSWHIRAEQARGALEVAQTQISQTQDELASVRHALEKRVEVLHTTQEVVTSLRVEVATLQQEKNNLDNSSRELKNRQTRIVQRIAQLFQDDETTKRTLLETDRLIQAASITLVGLHKDVGKLNESLLTLGGTRQEIDLAVRAAERELRSQQQLASQIENVFHRSQVQVERLDLELNHALNRLSAEYQMAFDWAKAHYPDVMNASEVKQSADILRRRLNELGNVQLGAIDEWTRLSERLNFLTSERNDLEAAKQDLFSIIGDIEEEMSRRFIQAFEQIRAEFQISFRQLFEGGRANLEFTHPNDILHTGIDVIAQPPGKKLQNLNLMSGGERALTAMALLFAILKVRPVPFCVLDEVEAALDESNVARFANQLRRFVTDTQFIVITHRRGTMEEADVLYGVTMRESGVSSLVSVRLGDETDTETA